MAGKAVYPGGGGGLLGTWNTSTARLALLFLIAAGAAGCSGKDRSSDPASPPPVPERLAQMDRDLVEHIDQRLSAVREEPGPEGF